MRFLTRLLLFALLSSMMAGTVLASGFSIFEQGAKATAMGGAFAATADDPSAIFYNVAGLAQQRRFTIFAGGTTINFANQFRGDPNDEFTSGATGQYRRHTFVPPNAYVTIPVGNSLTFGVGVMTPYGLRTNWEDPWVGRFVSKDASIKVVSVEPALAWQTADGRFAIGAGAEYRRAHIILQRNNAPTGSGLNPFTGRIVDVANVYLNSDWDSAWGFNVGALFKSDKFRIGASYRSDMDIDFKGDATFTQIPTGNAQLDAIVRAGLPPNQGIAATLPFPATAIVGLAVTTIPNTDVEFDFTHTTWSRFKTLDIVFAQTPRVNLSRPQLWNDTNSYRIGVNHAATPDWDVRFGLVYDENPQPVEAVSPLLPDADREGVSFGVGHHRGPWIIDGTVFVLHFKTRGTEGRSGEGFNGTYKTNATLLSFNLGYRF
ncbi:MAG TPA: outer membrane protein transport protein [Thermoanaerobaculia bacterium]|nr:outer membrane protein transport protein [Thermoanaerobaculia bacterium]